MEENKVVLYNGFWIIDGNCFNANIYDETTAKLYASTLKNCFGCVDCINCIDCNHCVNCYNCKNCEYYSMSSGCEKCLYCYNCNECSECKNCNNAYRLNQCNNIAFIPLQMPLKSFYDK